MLALSSGLLRTGLALKLNQIKRATRSYLRDRTNQATSTAASHAVAAGLFAAYLSNFGNYTATYGSLGAAIGLMMWMWMSAIIVLCGAELNSELEHQTALNRRPSQTARRPRRRDGRHAGTGGSLSGPNNTGLSNQH